MRNEAAANCQERAREIDRLPDGDSTGRPPDRCRIYTRTACCPLIDAATLDLPQGHDF
jgi:hypothetical protein